MKQRTDVNLVFVVDPSAWGADLKYYMVLPDGNYLQLTEEQAEKVLVSLNTEITYEVEFEKQRIIKRSRAINRVYHCFPKRFFDTREEAAKAMVQHLEGKKASIDSTIKFLKQREGI